MIRTYFVFFVLIDHILNLLCLLLSVQGSYKLFLLVRKNDCTILMKYKKVTLHFEEKRQKYKFVVQYQVFTIIQLNYLCFFFSV